MGLALKVISVLCLLFVVNITSELTFDNTTLTSINSNFSKESTTNHEVTTGISSISFIVTRHTSMSPETTSIKSKNRLPHSKIVGCTLELADVSIKQQVQSFLAEGKELIFLHFYLLNKTKTITEGPNDTIYNIFTIVRTKGGFGNEFLVMHPQFEQFSLGTLMFGVEHVRVPIQLLSTVCLTQKELNKALFAIVRHDLNLLTIKDNKDETRLCQIHIEDVEGLASFYYNCCKEDSNGNFFCSRLETNRWMDVLIVSMNICYVIVFLYSPLLIPTSWYKAGINEITLRFQRSITLKLSDQFHKECKTKKPEELNEKIKVLVGTDESLLLKVNEIKLKILEMKTVSTDYVPAGIFHYLYRTFIKCQEKDHKYVKDCCDTDICKCSNNRCLMWHQCLLPLMQLIFLLFLLIPWVVRIVFFFVFESDDRNSRESFARKINLKYPNILQWSLTYSLKPYHSFFICIYVFIAFIPFCKSFLKQALQSSGINDNTRRSSSEIEGLVGLLVYPCTKLGLAGCLISPFYIMIISPFVIIRFILPNIPIFKVSWTLLYGLAKGLRGMYKAKWKTWNCSVIAFNLLRSTILIMVFMAIGSSMFICLEVVIFFLQIGLYFAIGIILNASSVLTYATFAGMLLFYVYDTLRNVREKYEAFSQAIIDFSVSDMQKQVIETFKDKKELQCSAFQFKILNEGSDRSHIKIEFEEKRNKLLLQSQFPCLFLDENSKPYLNEKAFFIMCKMKVLRAPGSLWENYKKAAFNFMVIAFFLTFVVIIVLAFGKTQGIPGTYQAIATLGGGLIPLILRRYFFKSEDVFDFKTDHFLLRGELQQLLEDNWETWEIVNISYVTSDGHKSVIDDSRDEIVEIDKSQMEVTELLSVVADIEKDKPVQTFNPQQLFAPVLSQKSDVK